MNKDSAKKPVRICFIAPKAYSLFNPEYKGIIGGAKLISIYLQSNLQKTRIMKSALSLRIMVKALLK